MSDAMQPIITIIALEARIMKLERFVATLREFAVAKIPYPSHEEPYAYEGQVIRSFERCLYCCRSTEDAPWETLRHTTGCPMEATE